MRVEVVYATAAKQVVVECNVSSDLSVVDILKLSAIDKIFPELNFNEESNLVVGVFGKKIDIAEYSVKENDRLEIYRRLHNTPNAKRLERFKKNAK
jgi:putative ubiquitin-RnfH superfamily antitoxin RatB of RatAB toxin-antitoxin module